MHVILQSTNHVFDRLIINVAKASLQSDETRIQDHAREK